MKRRIIHFILIAALVLFTVSCGIPNIYVPSSSDVSISTSSSANGTFTVKLSQTLINELRDGSPTLYFFYTISESSQSSCFSNAISNLNSTYCSETSGQIIDGTSGKAIATYTTGSGDEQKTYGVYQLSLASFDLKEVKETSVYTLKVNTYDNDYTLMLCDEDGNVISRLIKRYNSEVFRKSQVNEGEEATDYSVSNVYTVKVYALISCQFDSYNNVFNTKISSSSPILEFQLDE